MTSPEQLLEADRWELAEGTGPSGPATLRYRIPVLSSEQTASYDRCLRIVWTYADEGSGLLPDPDTVVQLEQFENHLCEALEQDALAVLAAVLTLDGARQWVLYTTDTHSCGERINGMPQRREPYPIELDSFMDPGWAYLRDDTLSVVRAAKPAHGS